MPLPSLENLSALDLLRLADNPEGNALLGIISQVFEGKKPEVDDMPLEQLVWHEHLAYTGGLLKKALEQLSANDVIDLWLSKSKADLRLGSSRNFLYDMAWRYHKVFRKPLMFTFRKVVLPGLIELGEIGTDADGNVDPYQLEEARKSFLKAMQRRRG